MIDRFAPAKSLLMEDVANFYHVPIDFHKKSLCPFHEDTHKSFSVKAERWRCFTCDMGGDSVDFVSKLYNISSLEALRKLDDDFHLGINFTKNPAPNNSNTEPFPRQDVAKAFEHWITGAYSTLCIQTRILERSIEVLRPSTPFATPSREWLFALSTIETIKYWRDLCAFGELTEKLAFYKENRKEVAYIAAEQEQFFTRS